LTDLLLLQVQPGIKQKAKGADLEMEFHIHIAIASGLSLARALGMVVMVIHSLQVFRGFALLAQAVSRLTSNLSSIPAARASSRTLASMNFLRG
jgi:hypothetical protein